MSELSDIEHLLNTINEPEVAGYCYIEFDKDSTRTEKALHRLIILGIINDYTVDYSNKEFEVILSGIGKQEIIHKYSEYVKGYNKGRVEQERNKLEQYIEDKYKKFVLEASEILLSFLYDTIEKGRRRGLREMLSAAEEALKAENENDLFRNRILRYLESDYYNEIENIINASSLGFPEITRLCDGTVSETGELIGGIKSPKDAFQIRGEVSRYLESLPDHPALLFLRSISEIYCSEYDKTIVMENVIAGVCFSINRYNVKADELYSILAWVLSAILNRNWEIYLDLFDYFNDVFKDPEFSRAVILANDYDEEMIIQPYLSIMMGTIEKTPDYLEQL